MGRHRGGEGDRSERRVKGGKEDNRALERKRREAEGQRSMEEGARVGERKSKRRRRVDEARSDELTSF